MRLHPSLGTCVLAGLLSGSPVHAQPVSGSHIVSAPAAAAPGPAGSHGGPDARGDLGPRISLRMALEAAWQRSTAALESEGARRRAQAERLAADTALAGPPSLELIHRDDRMQSAAGKRTTDLALALPLWLPGQRGARADALTTASARTEAAEQWTRLQLAGTVREAAWQLVGLRAEVAQADALAHLLARLADDVDRRVQAGDLARADALAARAEHLAARAVAIEVRQRLAAARARWVLITGRTADPDPGAFDPEENAASPGDAGSHPESQLARESLEVARRRLELVRVSRRDPPQLTLGVRQESPGLGAAAQGSLLVGLRMPLDTVARNHPLETAALAELEVARNHEARTLERIERDIGAARETRQAIRMQREAESARARLLRERATLIERSFQAGESPLPELLRALAAAAQADSAVARQDAALGLAHARLQQALGVMP
jgi:cobalt-zinc-cadmium efflux system outer membrane protein